MKAAILYGPRDIRVEEVETPRPGAGEVLIRVKAAGICGSDLHFHRADPAGPIPPRPLGGHEFSGVVAEVGEGVEGVRIGERVGVEPLKGCGGCRFCAAGHYHLCPDLKHLSGGFAEYACVPADKVFPLPDAVSDEAAALLDCLAVGVHAVQRAAANLTGTALVIGDAAIGLSTLQVAKANGAGQVGLLGHHDSALQIGARLGADFTFNAQAGDWQREVLARTGGLGAEVIYESVGGRSSALAEAIHLVRPGGTIVVIGSFTTPPPPDYRRLLRHEVNLLFSWSYAGWEGVPEFQIALDLLADGRAQLEPLITHRFPLDQIGAAFAAALDKHQSGALKVLVQP